MYVEFITVMVGQYRERKGLYVELQPISLEMLEGFLSASWYIRIAMFQELSPICKKKLDRGKRSHT